MGLFSKELPMITLKQLVHKVRELATASPDNKYVTTDGKNCFYNSGQCSNGSVGCIFGQALRALGVTEDIDIWSVNAGTAEYSIRSLIPKLVAEGYMVGVTLEHTNILSWCAFVQSAQDEQQTWGEAIQRADGQYSIPY
jgi:hypothetical protein